MVFGALRFIIRPVSRTLSSRVTSFLFNFPTTSHSRVCDHDFCHLLTPFPGNVRGIPTSTAFHSLTDTRFPKRRPSDKPRQKRINLKPPGPYVWVKSTPEEPLVLKQPNQGSVKRRNEKKRIKQHRAFVLSEKKKRKAQVQEANRKKVIKRVERKMGAVARERAWAERLVELQQLEEKKKKTVTAVMA